MGRNLRKIFDYQRFEGNERLGAMIAHTEGKYLKRVSLEDDDLAFLNAAGSRSLEDREECDDSLD